MKPKDEIPEEERGSSRENGAGPARITGRVITSGQTSVPNATVAAYSIGLGSETKLGDGVADAAGKYLIEYMRGVRGSNGKAPDIQVRAALEKEDLGASEVLYNAPNEASVDVVVPAEAVVRGDEHTRLVGDLTPHVEAAPDRERLGDLEETSERRDITYLANKTGWDARAVAMAAAADQMSGGTKLPSELFYALFRAGVPANPEVIARTQPEIAKAIWKRSIASGVIPKKLERSLPKLALEFIAFASDALLNQPAAIGVSSLDDTLEAAGLSEAERQGVARLYTTTVDRSKFWSEVADEIGPEAAGRLATAAKLAYLTVNNAPLIRKLSGVFASGDPVSLVRDGLYDAAAWRDLIDDAPIPEEIPGANDEERRANYSELLASQLEISYPTAVVAAMVEREELGPADRRVAREVATFLAEHQGDFELGEQPVERYLHEHDIGLSDGALAAAKTLQRQFQLSPSNDAMKVLASSKIDSAFAATRYGEGDFIAQFAESLGGDETARVIYAKAQQVHGAALNVTTAYLMSRTTPGVYAVPRRLTPSSGDGDGAPDTAASTAHDVIAYPTLEQLFGELEYCACSHCRSVLSPCAYLVDLLLFCDRRRFNAAGEELPTSYEKENPLDVLLSRRPDLAQLQLTCENTNVALPYVDLVNEVLEHFVVNKSLTTFGGYNVDPEDTSAELIASPQHTDLGAYTILAGESFPLELPFHRPLAALRAYIGRVDTSLADTMEVLRKSDSMNAGGGAAYGWRDILTERLGIGRDEYRLLTDSTVPLTELYGEDALSDAATIAVIGNAKTFARRLRLDYDKVVELTRTRFVNPESWMLPRLERLGVSLETIKEHHDGTITDAELDARLPSRLDTTPYGGDPKQWLADHYDEIGSLIVLRDPEGTDECSFEAIRLQHALSGDELTPVEALRMIRFVRLWRRLGWTIDETDRALMALWPAAQQPLAADDDATARAKLDAGFGEALERLGHLRRVMDHLELGVKRDLSRALAFWAPIDAAGGPASLYHKMFLASSILESDPAFDENASGEVLNAAGKLVDHGTALEAAFNLKGGELALILEAAGFDDQTDLTLANVSEVFRWAFMARKLRLNAGELIALVEITGIDPFETPVSPRPALVRFLEIAERLRDSGVRVPLLMYLLQHHLQRGAPEPKELLALAKTLHDDLARIENENAPVEDPNGDVARAKMALVYGQPAADAFLDLVTGAVTFDVSYAQLQPALHPTVLAAAPGLSYDHLTKRLRHTGLLSVAHRNAVQALPAATPALSTAVGDLVTAGQDSTQKFFGAYPELETLYAAVMAEQPEDRTASILGAFLPQLRTRLQELHLLQAVASDADLTPADVDRLLRDPAVLHKIDDVTTSALADLMGVGANGASMAIYDGSDVAGAPSTVETVVQGLDYAAPDNPLPANSENPSASVSGVWRWWLDPPANGFFNLAVEADAAATVELRIDDRPVVLAAAGGVWEVQDPIELKAGELRDLRLTVRNVRNRLAVRWQSAGLPLNVIPSGRMLPSDLLDAFASTYTRLLKALALAAQFGLDGEEVAWFATRPSLAVGGDGWLNALPVAAGATAATVQGLFTALIDLVGYSELRRDLRLRDRDLLDLLRDPAKVTDDGRSVRSELIGWPDDAVAAVLTHLGLTEADLDDVDELRRLKRVLEAADEIGVSASTLFATVTNDPTDGQLADLQAALRARYDEEAWYRIVQPVNDSLRDQQRDALVVYVLHLLRQTPATAHIDTAAKLFEWFLVDIEMEPCMKTSRVRQALSSVQLFVQRSLLNLEPHVAASSFDSKRWSWMQRYRVWEANRKVFLMPENWLDPELRDDKSPLFKQLEGDLLGADITDEAAARALGRYLEGVAEVAKLEVDGMFVAEHETGSADDIVHVIARTAGARRKYFYRRQSRNAWTAWEPVSLDIEDAPVIPVVWRGRVFLFWLRVLEGPPTGHSALTTTIDKPMTDVRTTELTTSGKRRIQAMLQWSEHFNGAWQPPHTSDARKPVALNDLGVDDFDRDKLALYSREDGDSLLLSVAYGTKSTYFRLYTPHSLPVRAQDEPPPEAGVFSPVFFLLSRSRDFRVGQGLAVDYFDPQRQTGWTFTHDVLRRGAHGRVVEPHHSLEDVFSAPFFYEDRRHVFFVRPETSIIQVPQYEDISILSEPPFVRVRELPPIRLIPEVDLERILPDLGDPYPGRAYHGMVDSTPVGTYLDNVNIHTEIGAVGTFVFGDQVIAPGGAVDTTELEGVLR